MYSSLLKNMPDVVGIPITPAITQNIGIVWRKGSYTTDSAEKFISYVIKNLGYS